MAVRGTIRAVTEAAAPPVSLTEVKAHARITGTESDEEVRSMLRSATTEVESYTWFRLVEQTLEMLLDDFPSGDAIELPPPLQSVVSVKYIDTDGVEQTLLTTEYTVDTASEPARLYEAYDKTWPSVRSQPHAVTVRFVSGYLLLFDGTAAGDLLTPSAAQPFADSSRVRVVQPSGSTLPVGLAEATDYYVRDAGATTFKLATAPGGTAVDLTVDGVGQSLVGQVPADLRQAIMEQTAHLFDNRESAGVGLTPHVESVLSSYHYRTIRF